MYTQSFIHVLQYFPKTFQIHWANVYSKKKKKKYFRKVSLNESKGKCAPGVTGKFGLGIWN